MPRKGNVKGSKVRGHAVSKKRASRKETSARESVTEQSVSKVINDKSPTSKETGAEKKIPSYFLSSPESKKGLLSTESGQTSSSLDTDESVQDKTRSNYSTEKQHDGFLTKPRSDLNKQSSSVNEKEETITSSVLQKLSKEHSRKPSEEFPSKDMGNVKEIINESRPLMNKGEDVNTRLLNTPIMTWSSSQKTLSKGKGKKGKSKTESKHRQSEVSDYFAVRRSDRKCKSTIEDEKRRKLEEALLSGKEEDLEIQIVEGKGRGIFTKRYFSRGEFVCEYAGELIDYDTAKEREKFYEGKMEFGCYMYYFNFKNKKFCVDATRESGRLGRLLNHSRTEANCATRLISIKERPYLILETIKDVKEGEELMYDYGERSKDIVQSHPWLKR